MVAGENFEHEKAKLVDEWIAVHGAEFGAGPLTSALPRLL